MNTTAYFAARKTLRRLHQGPLGPFIDDFANWLQEQHYSCSSGRTFVRAIANWSLWLHRRGVACRDINAGLLDRYVRYGARVGIVGLDDRRGLQKMLAWLQRNGVIPATSPRPPVSQGEIVRDDFQSLREVDR